MFAWDDLRFFLAVQREGTLARAAKQLQLDATTVGRRLTQLEEQLGARLFDRGSKGFVLTEAGRRLLPHAEGIEREAFAVARTLSGDDQKLEGIVRVTATETITTRFIAPYLSKFRERYPAIVLDLVCTNRDLDLARGAADIALRLARPKQEDVIVKKLLSIELALYASQDYVDRHGLPKPGALAEHRFILFADTPPFRRENQWIGRTMEDGHVVLRSDSVSSVVSAALGSLGIALLPVVVGEREPRLIRAPMPGSPEPRVIWQAVHRDLMGAARVRAVLDFLGRIFRARPAKRSGASRG